MRSQPRARDRRCPGHADRGNQARCEKSQRGALGRRKPYRAPDPRKLGWSGPERGWATQKPYVEGNLGVQVNGAREIPVVLVDRRDCRRRRGVSTAMRKQAEGRGVDGRRPDSARPSTFDEAAVEAGLALPRKERDRGRQRLAGDRPRGRTRHREGATSGGLSIKSSQVRAPLVPLGNRGTSKAMPKLGARRQARLYPRSRRSPKLRLGGRPWKHRPRRKSETL